MISISMEARRTLRRFAAVAVSLFGVLSIVATSGGSSNDDDDEATGPFSNASLTGTYALVFYGHNIDSDWGEATYTAGMEMPNPTGFYAGLVTFSFDGAGGFTFDSDENDDGVTTSDMGSGTYSVTPSGTVTADFGDGNEAFGQLVGDGSVVVAGQVTAEEDPEIAVMIPKDGTGLTDADLDGEYFYVAYSNDSSAGQPTAPAAGSEIPAPLGFEAEVGTFDFDGAGMVTITTEFNNEDGSITGTEEPFTVTYTVGATGDIVIDGVPGVMRGDGEILILSETVPDEDPNIIIAVRKRTTPYTATELQGTFGFAYFQHDPEEDQPLAPMNGVAIPSPLGFVSEFGALSFDVDTYTGSVTRNIDGNIETEDFGPDPYALDTDGFVTLDGDPIGFMSADGSILLFSGMEEDDMEDDESPSIFIGVRQ